MVAAAVRTIFAQPAAADSSRPSPRNSAGSSRRRHDAPGGQFLPRVLHRGGRYPGDTSANRHVPRGRTRRSSRWGATRAAYASCVGSQRVLEQRFAGWVGDLRNGRPGPDFLTSRSGKPLTMRQCPTCGKVFVKALGVGGHCSTDCQLADVRRARAKLRVRWLLRWLKGQ